ncbi:MAG TPA: EamA family transporter [Solirubrobacteraceae bacterium]|nr:EamA family transporter [Solirubrobacteraceae bacterium]
MQPRDSLRATLVAIVWGANFVVIEEGLKGFPPFLLLAARFLLVAFPLILFVPRPGPWRPILLVGVFMSLGQFSLLYLSLQLGMPAGLSSILLQAQVMFGIVISSVVLREHASRRQVTGVVVGLAGLGTVALSYSAHAPLAPLALTLGAALSWAVGNVISRRSQLGSGPGLVVWSAIVVPLPALGMALLVNGPHAVGRALAHTDLLTVASTLYTVALSSLFGYVTWNSLLTRYPVGAVTPFALLVPVAGTVSAWIVLGQVPTVAEAAGGVVLLGGVATASLRRPPAAARPAASSADPYPASAPPAPPPLDSR